MKKAVIKTGNKQYLVSEGEQVEVELLKGDSKLVEFVPLLIIEDGKADIGTPTLEKNKVTADVVEADIQTDKVTSIRYKSKKRVRTVRGHRQHKSVVKIKKIA
ncbi:MAG TPA: 50S ribosomal protein L21 [Candidatus Sulfotelmatobacter sp.]|nr:50S ribosomal protein L21 [Candidatus Sulfotelmatobacter sp.]